MIKLSFVTPLNYAHSLNRAWVARPEIAAAVTDYRDVEKIPSDASCYLSEDSASGFMINSRGEILGLFSTVKGRGDDLVEAAKDLGGYLLDCFDGYLPTLYARHGFVEVGRFRNWTRGGPDVIVMELPEGN